MRWCGWLLLVATGAGAEDRWIQYSAGPFEVLTDAGTRAGRETLVRFEEFRHGLGQVIGEQNLETPVPMRVMVFRNAKAWATPEPVIAARDRYAIVMAAGATATGAVFRECTRVFLETGSARLPASFERGLIDFFSTLEVSGIRITVGKPPALPNLDWARVALLVTDPQYFGRLRVVLYNLRRGVDEDVAYRNAFSKSAAEIDKEARAHLAAGNFQTASLSSLPMSARDFSERPVADAAARLARADLLIAGQSEPEYRRMIQERVSVAESYEGLGVLALRAGHKDEARKNFAAAIEASSASARCYIEHARLEPDDAAARKALERAAALNPKLAEPHWLLAQRESDPERRMASLKAATERNPRQAEYWKALAETALAQHNYGEAAKAWRAGEQAATDPAERDRMRQARMAIERQRLDWEAAERKREAEEKAREIDKLKVQARAEVRDLERRYNQGEAPAPAEKVVQWWDGPKPAGKVHGMLKQVDCLGKQARITVEGNDGKSVKLLVADPGQVPLLGKGGEQTLSCGPQKARRVSVEYFPKPNAKLATAGEVATIEFQ